MLPLIIFANSMIVATGPPTSHDGGWVLLRLSGINKYDKIGKLGSLGRLGKIGKLGKIGNIGTMVTIGGIGNCL